jgi:hypothetical protein
MSGTGIQAPTCTTGEIPCQWTLPRLMRWRSEHAGKLAAVPIARPTYHQVQDRGHCFAVAHYTGAPLHSRKAQGRRHAMRGPQPCTTLRTMDAQQRRRLPRQQRWYGPAPRTETAQPRANGASATPSWPPTSKFHRRTTLSSDQVSMASVAVTSRRNRDTLTRWNSLTGSMWCTVPGKPHTFHTRFPVWWQHTHTPQRPVHKGGRS